MIVQHRQMNAISILIHIDVIHQWSTMLIVNIIWKTPFRDAIKTMQ